MTRTLAAVAVTMLLGGACARAPRAVTPAPRGSMPMHTLVPRPSTFEPGQGGGFQLTPTTAIHVAANTHLAGEHLATRKAGTAVPASSTGRPTTSGAQR